MNASTILGKEYKGARNFMTPTIHEEGILFEDDRTAYAYEISSGEGIFTCFLVGVSIVHYDKITGKTDRNRGYADKAQAFSGDNLNATLKEARQFLNSLGKEIRQH